MSEPSTTFVDKVFDKVVGPFGALVISLVALSWLAQKFEVFVDKTIEQHDEDRLLYKQSMEKMTDQLIDNSRKIDVLTEDVKELSEDVKTIKGE